MGVAEHMDWDLKAKQMAEKAAEQAMEAGMEAGMEAAAINLARKLLSSGKTIDSVLKQVQGLLDLDDKIINKVKILLEKE